jgi:GNAT superfamily N-acetyltransferase
VTVAIRDAGPDDLAHLDWALRALSDDLGDRHRAGPDLLARACLGPDAFAAAILAVEQGTPVGAALFSPAASTTLGGAGVLVSDLWVDARHRGAGLGRRLLAAVARRGASRWGCIYLKLAVYTSAPGARGFYEHLGLAVREDERNAILTADAYADLAGDLR